MKKILIVDDHAVVRTGLQLILESTGDLMVAGECGSGYEVLILLEKEQYDLIILDIHIPGTDTIELLKILRKHYRAIPVVIFTMNTDDAFMVKLFQIGAAAYINKTLQPDKLIEILRKVLLQKRFITEDQAIKIANLSIDSTESPTGLESLTTREYQVFKLIASGKAYDNIADELGLSKNTLANHRMSILKKLGLKNNADLTRFAIRYEVIQ